MKKVLFFPSCVFLLATPIFVTTSCQQSQNQAGNLVYGEFVKCSTKQEIDILFQNNIQKWPRQQKDSWSKQEFENKKNKMSNSNKNMFFDLIASICKFANVDNFSLSWENDKVAKLTISDIEYNNVEYDCVGTNNKIVLGLKNQSNNMTISSFEYQDISIEK